MTLIMGAYYDKGLVMMADRRMMQGYKYTTDAKLFTLRNGEVIVTFSGATGMADELRTELENSGQFSVAFQGASTLYETLDQMGACVANIRQKYIQRGTFTADDSIFGGLVGGLENLTSGRPLLYMLGQTGYPDPIHRTSSEPYASDGVARDLADSLLKTFYKPALSKERLIEVLTYVMLKVEEINSAVGGMPHIAILEDGALPNVMNEQETNKVVEKIKGINSIVAKTFWKILEEPAVEKQILSLLESEHEADRTLS